MALLNCSSEANYSNRDLIIKYVAYIIIGGLSSCWNLALAVTIALGLSNKRKVFQIIKYLALAEFVEAFATLIGGSYRVAALLSPLHSCSSLPVYCVILPQSWLWRWSHIGCPLIALFLTFDRLFAVIAPQVYYFASRRTNHYIIFSCFLIGCVNIIVGCLYPLIEMDKTVGAMCKSDEFLGETYYDVMKKFTAIISSASVVLYIAVLVQLKRLLAPVEDASVWRQIQINKSRDKHRITVTLGICAAIRVVLDSLPRVYGSFFLITEETEVLASYFFVFNELNSLLCCVVIALRHREVWKRSCWLRLCRREKTEEKKIYRISVFSNSISPL